MRHLYKLKVFAVIGIFVFSVGCSKDKKANSDNLVSNYKIEEVKNSESNKENSADQGGDTVNSDDNINSDTNINSDGSTTNSAREESLKDQLIANVQGIIKDQVFEVTLDGFGTVTFAAVAPEGKKGTNSDVRFQLYDQGKEVYTFPGHNEENSLESDEFIKVLAVAFQDYNEDGKDDILIINEYANTLDDNRHYNEVRVYTQKHGSEETTQTSNSKEFTNDSLLEEYLMKNYYCDSIKSMQAGIKDYKEYEQSMDGSHGIEEQIALIAQNRDTWIHESDIAEGGYYYAVTDLDHNGRLELIASNIGGTGIYTYSDFYEVNEEFNGIKQCKTDFQEGDSQADIMTDKLHSFTDDSTGDEYYIFDDFMKSGAAEHYDNIRAITLKNGEIKEIMLAYKSTIYRNEKEFDLTCTDANNKEITEKQYEEIADTVFSDLKKNDVTIDWYRTEDNKELREIRYDELKKLLEKSYDGFTDIPTKK